MLLGGGFALRAEDLAFRLEPVLAVVAVFAAALLVELVGTDSDSFFQFSGIGNCAGWL